jgi:regulator of RNase E activity RraB
MNIPKLKIFSDIVALASVLDDQEKEDLMTVSEHFAGTYFELKDRFKALLNGGSSPDDCDYALVHLILDEFTEKRGWTVLNLAWLLMVIYVNEEKPRLRN